MAIRSYNFQQIHDRVISAASEKLARNGGFKVYTNPGGQRITSIGNLYPDIILTPPNSNNVNFIIEVETADSINANEALSEWKSYSNLGGTFYLLVPIDSRILAENICRQYGIRASFGTYSIDFYNQVTINYE